MPLSPRSFETLMDLLENRIACMEVMGREDMREMAYLHRCRNELNAAQNGGASGALGGPGRRRGRPPKALPAPVETSFDA